MHINLIAPAKVNFCLGVVGRRSDGYHLLESVVCPISLGDGVRISCTRGNSIAVSATHPGLSTGPDNLAYRAAELILHLCEKSWAVRIHLRKRIPMGAGLGGGSSDAAAVLTGLNTLCSLGFSRHRLAAAGAGLGADVPFFVHGEPAVIRGIGERVRPLPRFRRRWLVVAWPAIPISTAWAYAQLRDSLTKTRGVPMIRAFLRGEKRLQDILINDLEPIAMAAHPEVRSLKERFLQLGANGAMMTGSGSAVFGLFANQRQARRGAAALRRTGVWAEAVHTLKAGPEIRRR